MFRGADAYNSAMVTFRVPAGASEELSHAIELVNRDLEGLFEDLDNHQQSLFWSNLHQYALAQTQHKGRSAHLIASPEKIDEGVREALEMLDERLTNHLESLTSGDTDRFWQALHELAEEEAHETQQPKGRHGKGKR
jgi:hypothetical protein